MIFTNKFKDIKKFYTIIIVFIVFFNAILISKLHANSLKINGIEVKEDFNLNFNKKKVFDKAFKAAYAQLISTVITSIDKKNSFFHTKIKLYCSKYLEVLLTYVQVKLSNSL